MIGVHEYIGVKSNSKTLLYSTFLGSLLRIGLSSFKPVLWPKNLFFTKFENGYQNNIEFDADFETGEENAKN